MGQYRGIHTRMSKKGVTLTEIVVVVAILGFIVAITFQSFTSYRTASSVEKVAGQVAALVNEARSLTLASKEDTTYGVHFEASKVVMFAGDTYSSSSAQNVTVNLGGGVTASAIELTGGGSEVVFNRLDGTARYSGTTTLSVSGASTTKKIIVYPTGLTEIQ
jgi:prepilin-type N-terminal cleavage/methylation domain-containing protein